jgi:hypothetical protein
MPIKLTATIKSLDFQLQRKGSENMRKIWTLLLVFTLLVSPAAAFQQGQEKKKGPFSDQIKQQEQERAPLLPGQNLDPGIDSALAAAVRNRQVDEQREYSALYSQAEVNQYKQKLQPTAAELDTLRKRHEELLKDLGLRELTNEEKANLEDKESIWYSTDVRMTEVYNDTIFLSKMASRPPDSPFKSIALMIAGTYQARTVPAPPGGTAFIFNSQREGRSSYLNLALLPVTTTLPDQFKMKPLPELPSLAPVAPARAAKEKGNEPKKAPADAPEPSKKTSKAKAQRKSQAAAGGKAPAKGKAAQTKSVAAKATNAKDQPAETAAEEMKAGNETASAQTTTGKTKAESAPATEAPKIGLTPQATDSNRGVGVSAKNAGANGNGNAASAAAQPSATSPVPVTDPVTAVKSPNVQFENQSSSKASATNGSADPSAAAKDISKSNQKGGKENKNGGFGDFMKGVGKAVYAKVDPKGVEAIELKSAFKRTFSKIDIEDEFFFSNRLQYSRLYEQFDQAPLRSDKERIRKEMAALLEKEQKLENLYGDIKAKHDRLTLQQNAINIAEDSAHFIAGKYASGVKNILITRANYVEAKKYRIPKSQWPDLYLSRFVCPKGQDCRADYEKLAQENFAAVEKAEQAKDPNAQASNEANSLVLPRADETLRKPNKCETQPFAYEKSDGNCWVMQEVDGVRIYRSRFPFWEAHRSLEMIQDGIATLIVYSALESVSSGKPTVSKQGLVALAGSFLETAFLPRQLTEVGDVYYKVVYDRSYSQGHLGFIADEITKSLPGVKPYFAPSLEEYAKAGKPWFTQNGPTGELKDFIRRAEQANNGVKFDAILEWEGISNTEATRVRLYSLAAAEQIKGKTPVAFEFLYPGDGVEKKKKKGDNQPPDLNHLRWFGQEAIPDYKSDGYFKQKSRRNVGEMVLDRKEVFHYALNYFFKDMRALQQ